MTERTGIFAALRRRRWALCLVFSYALLLNALLGTAVAGAEAAARPDPLAAIATAPLCGQSMPGASGSDRPGHHPTDHQTTCLLCGPACPMGGCAPVAGAGAIPLLATAFSTSGFSPVSWPRGDAAGGRSLYASDTDSQGPPAA